MSGEDDAFFNWSGAAAPEPVAAGDYRRKLHIRYQQEATARQRHHDPFSVLAGLRLLAEDKTYLRGFMAALNLPEYVQHGLLLEYRQRWERAAQRTSNPNQADNNGRRSANIWLQQGAKGFIYWQ